MTTDPRRRKRTARLWIRGHVLRIPRWAAKIVAAEIRLQISDFRWSQQGIEVTQKTLHYPGEGKFLFIPAGLCDRVVRRLKELGHRVACEDQNEWAPGSCAAFSDQLRVAPSTTVQDFLIRVAATPRLYYYAPRENERRALFKALTAAFPDKNILVVVHNLQETWRLSRQVRPLAREVSIGTRHLRRCHGVVQIDWPGSFRNRMRQCWDLIVVFDPDIVASARFQRDLEEFYRPTPARIAFGPPHRAVTPTEATLIEAMFGSLLRPPTDDAVTVCQILVHSSPLSRPGDWIGRKLANIWNHEERNRLVAQLATLCASGSAKTLGQLFGDGRRRAPLVGASGATVVVLVDSLRHAHVLQGRLGGWPVACLAGDGNAIAGPPTPGHRIATLASAEQHLINADIVILADGLQRTWPPGVRLPVGSGGSPTTIIDIADAFDAEAQAAADSRLEDFEHRGWQCGRVVFPSWAAALQKTMPPARRRTSLGI